MTQKKSKLSVKKAKSSVEPKADKNTAPERYPQEGTVFIFESIPYIVESKDNLSVLCDESNDVACYSLVTGFTDINDWFSLVKSEKIEVIWCPKMGRVKSSKDFLGS